jgi:exopolyphosphatase / guanosine-5'-triphosphate,3'-diphosphate pyrophosphatase
MALIAVVDLGTNTTRLLVGEVDGGCVRELERRSEVTRLGEGVDASGRLADAAMERVLAVVARYRGMIDELEAERTVAVATSAVRDAENADAFRARLREELGVEPRTISGDEEARLTFLGATNGRPPEERMMVLDIGGGSTEFVVGHPGSQPSFHVSTQAGSVRQTERHIAGDPPDPDEIASMAEEVQAIVTRDVPEGVRGEISRGIAVAGTATSLAAIDQKVEHTTRVDGYELQRAACEQMLALLASLPLERRREVTGLHPDRAPTIVAGAVIIVEAMRAFGLESMETSEADILHGAALAAAAANSVD